MHSGQHQTVDSMGCGTQVLLQHCFPLRKALLCQTESNAPDTGVIYIIRIQPQKSQRLICSFVHKGSILTVLLLNYSSTSIGLLQYSYWITPVLLSESIKVLTHASPPNPFPHQLVYPFPRELVNLKTEKMVPHFPTKPPVKTHE